nr:DUF4158 domain-containing protein [Nocardia farcinica]
MSAYLGFVEPGRGRGPAERLGLAIALCTLPWLGFVPDRLVTAPPVAVARLAEQLRVDPVVIGAYGRRAKTRTEHVRLAARYLGWRAAGALEFKELDEFLLARAMEHDSPTLLFRLACEGTWGPVERKLALAGLVPETWCRGEGDLSWLAHGPGEVPDDD